MQISSTYKATNSVNNMHYASLYNVKFTSLNPSKKIVKNSVLSAEAQNLLGTFKKKYDYKTKKPVQWKLKRTIDYVGATAGLILTSPIMLLASALIKLESKGPVIFQQKRIGLDGKEFVFYKFRGMYDDAPKTYFALNSNKDPNITKVGRVLRKFSIDEFPQFINILKGDMSLIGPRPVVYEDIDKLDSSSIRRFAVRPGANLNYKSMKGRDLAEKAATEKEYLDNWNLTKDLKIIGRIIKDIVTGHNF